MRCSCARRKPAAPTSRRPTWTCSPTARAPAASMRPTPTCRTPRTSWGPPDVTVASLRSQLSGHAPDRRLRPASDHLGPGRGRGIAGPHRPPAPGRTASDGPEQPVHRQLSRGDRHQADDRTVAEAGGPGRKPESQLQQHRQLGRGCPIRSMSTCAPNCSAAQVQVAILQRRVAVATDKLDRAKKNATEMISINNKYADLDRDYNVLETNYSELVKSREQARMSQSMSDQQQEHLVPHHRAAQAHRIPRWPPRRILNSMVLLTGIGCGPGPGPAAQHLRRPLHHQRGTGGIFLAAPAGRRHHRPQCRQGAAGPHQHHSGRVRLSDPGGDLRCRHPVPHHLHLYQGLEYKMAEDRKSLNLIQRALDRKAGLEAPPRPPRPNTAPPRPLRGVAPAGRPM